MWKAIEGYKWPYRINEEAVVQKFYQGKWVQLKPYLGSTRARVKMRTKDNKRVDVPLVWLMADAFMGGRRPGICITHKNGSKLDCALCNLQFSTHAAAGKISGGSRRRAVLKINRKGEVVDIYPSVVEASRRNHLSRTAVWHRCTNKVKDPFELDGFNYQYDQRKGGRKPKQREEA